MTGVQTCALPIWGWFSVEREEMGTGHPPNSLCGPRWRVPRGLVLWPRGALPSGPWWPPGAPLLAVSSSGKITYLQIFLEFFEKIFYRDFSKQDF